MNTLQLKMTHFQLSEKNSPQLKVKRLRLIPMERVGIHPLRLHQSLPLLPVPLEARKTRPQVILGAQVIPGARVVSVMCSIL